MTAPTSSGAGPVRTSLADAWPPPVDAPPIGGGPGTAPGSGSAPAVPGLRLADLIRPVPLPAFLGEDWQRAARHYPSGLGGRGAELLDLASFELLLSTLNRAHEGWLHLVREGSRPVPDRMVDAEGMLRLAPVRAAFRDGHTLYLTKAHRVAAPLMRLGRAVEEDLRGQGVRLRSPVSAHVFLTPPRSRGFPPHRDEHASLVLQLEGTKDWEVYPDVRRPDEPRRPGLVGPGELGGPPTTVRLSAGDALYVPEWWVHAARTGEAHSLHVTLRLFPLRWLDVLRAVLPDLAALDRPVPRAAGGPEAVVRGLCRLLDGDAVRARLPDAVRVLLERMDVPETVLPDDGLGGILAAPRIDAATSLVRAAGMVCTVRRDGEEVRIGYPGGSMSGPVALEPVFRYVATVGRLRPADLPAASGEYDRVGLARELVLAGILRPEAR